MSNTDPFLPVNGRLSLTEWLADLAAVTVGPFVWAMVLFGLGYLTITLLLSLPSPKHSARYITQGALVLTEKVTRR